MERMVRDLLDFTRAHLAGGITLSLSRCDLSAICQQVVEEARLAYPERAIRVELSGDLSGLWDGPRVAQAVANLVVNALEHGHREVAIAAIDDGPTVRVAVHNDGPPIPPERQSSLFEPFHPSRRSLGLGLYIVREIARIHGADLEVRSSVDDGTTFALRLPRTPPHDSREPRLFEA
jgi:signal transduction histidine kinase